MINHAMVESMLTEVDKNVSMLEGLKAIPKQAFVRDPHHHLLAERCFQLAIQCVLDICYLIAARSGWDKPADGSASLLLMGEKGVLPVDFARKIAPMANFRNILVHAYLHINREIVYDNLQRMDDFRTFQRHILRYLSADKGPDAREG